VTLEVSGLTAGYGGEPVLHDIDLSVADGAIVAILGANGAGKTTLLRTLSGLIRPTTGAVVFNGTSFTGTPVTSTSVAGHGGSNGAGSNRAGSNGGRSKPVSVEGRAHLGMAHVPEGGGVIAELTVDENLRLGGLWRKDRKDAAAAVAEIYDRFPPLAQRRSALGQQLSGGERQMLAVGRALAARPSMILLDEPSLGLAPRITTQIMEMLRDLRHEHGLSVLLVEQNVRAALSIADEGIVIALGRVVARTSAAEMLGDDAMRHAYLGF
jgi:branched-chain amino acid transport system ATP-binding protein